MPKRHDKITKSVNYDYYWDILFCTVPLLAVSCFYYGARPLLMMGGRAADCVCGGLCCYPAACGGVPRT